MEKLLKSIVDNWAVVTTAYIILGLISIEFYYLPYGINILTFCDLSEVLTIWFPQSTVSLIVTSLPILTFIALKADSKTNRGTYHYFHVMMNFAVLAAIIYIFLRYFININGLTKQKLEFIKSSLNFWVPVLICSILSLNIITGAIRSLVSVVREIRLKKPVVQESYNPLFSVIILSILSFTIPVVDVQSSVFISEPDKVRVILPTDTIVTKKGYMYIGKTKNYIMFYDKIKGSADVYSLQNASLINFGYSDKKTKTNDDKKIKL